jgi:hypothetical protein
MFNRPQSLYRSAVTGVLGLATAGLVGLAVPASAAAADRPGPNDASSTSDSVRPGGKAAKDGVCNTNELCLYWNADRGGAKLDLYLSDPNFSNDIFKGGGAGNGANANNEPRSFRSYETSVYWRVWAGASYTGTQIVCIAPGDRGNFSNSLWGQASSANWSTTPC